MSGRVLGRKPWRSAGGAWRGGRIVAVDGGEMTVEVLCAPYDPPQQYTCSVGLLKTPQGSPAAAGNAVAVKFAIAANDESPFSDWVIAEVRPAPFIGLREHRADAPNWGHVPYSFTGEDELYEL